MAGDAADACGQMGWVPRAAPVTDAEWARAVVVSAGIDELPGRAAVMRPHDGWRAGAPPSIRDGAGDSAPADL